VTELWSNLESATLYGMLYVVCGTIVWIVVRQVMRLRRWERGECRNDAE